MRDAEKIYVQRAIVHMIDHVKQELTRSDLELDLAESQVVRDYFGGQVANALADETTGSARFAAEGGNRLAIDACFGILSDQTRFVELSQELARLLMEAMKKQSITAGDLAVCLYTASNYPSTTFLALIKLDPGKALLQKVETRDGKQVVTFDVRTNVLPTEREKLQKAALVPPAERYAAFDLLLLDRQVPEVAAFFAKTFLNTVPARDAPTSTEIFYRTTHDAMKQLMLKPPEGVDPITVEESIAVQAHRGNAMRQPKVSISGFVKRLPLEKKARDFVGEKLKKAFPEDSTIEIDKPSAEKLLKKTRLKGEYGVFFEVETERYDDVVRKVQPLRATDEGSVTRLTVDVTNLQWLK